MFPPEPWLSKAPLKLAVSMLVLGLVMVAAHGPAAKGQDDSETVSAEVGYGVGYILQ